MTTRSSDDDAGTGEHAAVDALIALFNGLFATPEHTVLVRGDAEPVYLPAEGRTPARIVFAHGFFASALHEIAHWCIAGPARRLQADLGYWYAPDGRSLEQQREFERVEIKPQALEWIFTRAARRHFRVSCDNLDLGPYDIELFKRNIHAEVMRRFEQGLPPRASRFVQALVERYRGGSPLVPEEFDWVTLR